MLVEWLGHCPTGKRPLGVFVLVVMGGSIAMRVVVIVVMVITTRYRHNMPVERSVLVFVEQDAAAGADVQDEGGEAGEGQ